jgi:hypothetical protein
MGTSSLNLESSQVQVPCLFDFGFQKNSSLDLPAWIITPPSSTPPFQPRSCPSHRQQQNPSQSRSCLNSEPRCWSNSYMFQRPWKRAQEPPAESTPMNSAVFLCNCAPSNAFKLTQTEFKRGQMTARRLGHFRPAQLGATPEHVLALQVIPRTHWARRGMYVHPQGGATGGEAPPIPRCGRTGGALARRLVRPSISLAVLTVAFTLDCSPAAGSAVECCKSSHSRYAHAPNTTAVKAGQALPPVRHRWASTCCPGR